MIFDGMSTDTITDYSAVIQWLGFLIKHGRFFERLFRLSFDRFYKIVIKLTKKIHLLLKLI